MVWSDKHSPVVSHFKSLPVVPVALKSHWNVFFCRMWGMAEDLDTFIEEHKARLIQDKNNVQEVSYWSMALPTASMSMFMSILWVNGYRSLASIMDFSNWHVLCQTMQILVAVVALFFVPKFFMLPFTGSHICSSI